MHIWTNWVGFWNFLQVENNLWVSHQFKGDFFVKCYRHRPVKIKHQWVFTTKFVWTCHHVDPNVGQGKPNPTILQYSLKFHNEVVVVWWVSLCEAVEQHSPSVCLLFSELPRNILNTCPSILQLPLLMVGVDYFIISTTNNYFVVEIYTRYIHRVTFW